MPILLMRDLKVDHFFNHPILVGAGTGHPADTRVMLAVDANEIGFVVGAADACPSGSLGIRAKGASAYSASAQGARGYDLVRRNVVLDPVDHRLEDADGVRSRSAGAVPDTRR